LEIQAPDASAFPAPARRAPATSAGIAVRRSMPAPIAKHVPERADATGAGYRAPAQGVRTTVHGVRSAHPAVAPSPAGWGGGAGGTAAAGHRCLGVHPLAQLP